MSELEELFQSTKKLCRKHFLKNGEVMPRFLLEFDQVKARPNASPRFVEVCCPWSTNEEKRQTMILLRAEILSYGRLLRYCFVAE